LGRLGNHCFQETTDVDIFARLEATKSQTIEYFSLPEAQLDQNYGPGKWSVKFLLHHLADTETFYYDRIRRIVSEPQQVFHGFDEKSWSIGLDYSGMPIELSRDIYMSTRAAVIYQARLHYGANESHGFIHHQTGFHTLTSVFDKIVSHNEKHLGHIALALNR
jgi:hypothetical protein